MPASLTPARIFVGCDPNDCDLEQMMVLEYSLRKHASIPIEIEWMRLSRDPDSFWYSDGKGAGWTTDRWATPFSAFRWGIPAFCHFSGRALYVDADIMFMSDVAEMWDHDIAPGRLMLASGSGRELRLGELVWDCAAAKEVLPDIQQLRRDPLGHKKLQNFFEENPQKVQPLGAEYSNIDGDDIPLEQLKALHYSKMGTQFSHQFSLPRLEAEQKCHWFDGKIEAHPRDELRVLFEQYYHEAIAAGYSLESYRNPAAFGEFYKQSQDVSRGKKKKSLLKRLLGSLVN
ncbi:glycosyl transferase [Rouxiella sp. S1S-2]|uniref:glycosyl transferase n=1 Tax=Rouxiella sp. S1S-2 TaxID=2653856 RepID=UPI00126551D2|nr:glycosyl transferase [Rouxiella sp. S1S-2]KAB7897773.1 glycosyl transferase [Rouxiella sp. S1S-2]